MRVALRKDGNDTGNKMRGGKKCDFMININVAAATASRHVRRSRGDCVDVESAQDDAERLRTASMLLSLSVINGKTFLSVFARCATAQKAARYSERYICAVRAIKRHSRRGVAM